MCAHSSVGTARRLQLKPSSCLMIRHACMHTVDMYIDRRALVALGNRIGTIHTDLCTLHVPDLSCMPRVTPHA